jgi:hypothetical protein
MPVNRGEYLEDLGEGKRLSCPCSKLIKHYVMKTYGAVDVQIHIFLISALVEVEW